MITKVLAENTSSMDSLGCEHGLSLYINTNKHRILFDTGASNLFQLNAEKMRVDLSKVDTAIISHGHNDHGGGLSTFLALNQQAKVYLQAAAFGDYYAQRQHNEQKYIGLDKKLAADSRFVFTKNKLILDAELELFVTTKHEGLQPSGNKSLFKKENGQLILDGFAHEQNLVIQDGVNLVLIAGCAHNGIINILATCQSLYGRFPTHVIGGLHLHNPALQENEPLEIIDQLADYLAKTGARYYTCHCTGLVTFTQLESLLGSKKISYLATGNQLII